MQIQMCGYSIQRSRVRDEKVCKCEGVHGGASVWGEGGLACSCSSVVAAAAFGGVTSVAEAVEVAGSAACVAWSLSSLLPPLRLPLPRRPCQRLG